MHEDTFDRRDILILAALVLVGAFACAQAHQKALDPIIDTGRDLYIAAEIAKGRVLYRDFAYNYPPLAPYLLGGTVALFGASLTTYATFGIAVGALTLLALYLLVLKAAGRTAAASAGLLFVSLNLAGASTWGANYLFPYGYSATVGMLFSIAAVSALMWKGEGTSPAAETLAVIFALLACWSKLEYALSMTAVFIAAVALKKLSNRATVASLTIFASTAVEILLSRTVVSGDSAAPFYAVIAGTESAGRSIGLILLGASAIGAFVLLLRNVNRGGAWPLLIAVGLAILTWLLASDLFFRAWSLLAAVALVWAWRRKDADLLILSLFGAFSIARIPLNVIPGWYGFVLVLPVYVLIARVLFRELPGLGVYSRRAVWLWLPLIGLIATWGLMQQRERYALKQYPIATMRGTVYDANPDRARILNHFLEAASRSKPSTLAVFPEGVSLNYFLGTPTPLRRYIFTPPETEPFLVEKEVFEELVAKRPAAIVILTRDLTEFGSKGFGTDYNQRLLAWIYGQHRIAGQWASPRFALTVFVPDSGRRPAD